MRRHCGTREERLNAPRGARDDSCNIVGSYWRTDSGFWAWRSKDGRQGLAHTAREAIAKAKER